jgi:uncharacterized cupredoxin-like copper-binding protein
MTLSRFLRAAAPAAFTLSAMLAAPAALAASEAHGAGAGQPGKKSAVTRTINVTMYDNYYEPAEITVGESETVRFVVTNKGQLVHEFNIGTPEGHVAHAPMMQIMVDHGIIDVDHINWDVAKEMQKSMGHGMHEEPNSVLLEPGKSGELIWQFPDDATIEFACNVPGHYDSGMVGEIKL